MFYSHSDDCQFWPFGSITETRVSRAILSRRVRPLFLIQKLPNRPSVAFECLRFSARERPGIIKRNPGHFNSIDAPQRLPRDISEARWSAWRIANATIVNVGFSAAPVVNCEPSETNKFATSCD